MPAQRKDQMVTRAQQKARAARVDAKARKACVEVVWKRRDPEGYWGVCEGVETTCGQFVLRSSVNPVNVGHVDEIRSRALGGDPHDPDNCRLLCGSCHFSGPSGAHRHTPNWRDGVV